MDKKINMPTKTYELITNIIKFLNEEKAEESK